VVSRVQAGLDSRVPWLALVVAFSPTLAQWARGLREYPEDRVALLAPLLLGLAISRDSGVTSPSRRDGALALGFGIGLELLGLLSDAQSVSALGFPIAALGVARWLGHPRPVVMALLFFAVPLPDSILMLSSPELETAVAHAASATLRALGFAVEARGFSLLATAGRIELQPAACGAVLATAFAALGWYSAVRSGGGFVKALRRGALAALCALPVQALVVVVSGVLLAQGLRDAGWLWLTQGGWIASSVVGLAWIHGRASAMRRTA